MRTDRLPEVPWLSPLVFRRWATYTSCWRKLASEGMDDTTAQVSADKGEVGGVGLRLGKGGGVQQDHTRRLTDSGQVFRAKDRDLSLVSP